MNGPEILSILDEEQARARAMVAGLGHCRVRLSRSTTEFGSFTVERESGAIEIRISRHLRDAEQVRETVRHELAHQAAWERYRDLGHDGYWQTIALYLGCQPVPCGEDGFDPDLLARRQRYVVVCTSCGWTIRRQRRSALVTSPWRYACAECGGALQVG